MKFSKKRFFKGIIFIISVILMFSMASYIQLAMANLCGMAGGYTGLKTIPVWKAFLMYVAAIGLPYLLIPIGDRILDKIFKEEE